MGVLVSFIHSTVYKTILILFLLKLTGFDIFVFVFILISTRFLTLLLFFSNRVVVELEDPRCLTATSPW